MVIPFQNFVFGEIQFSEKFLTHRKKATPYPSRTKTNNIMLLLQAPHKELESPIPDLSNTLNYSAFERSGIGLSSSLCGGSNSSFLWYA